MSKKKRKKIAVDMVKASVTIIINRFDSNIENHIILKSISSSL